MANDRGRSRWVKLDAWLNISSSSNSATSSPSFFSQSQLDTISGGEFNNSGRDHNRFTVFNICTTLQTLQRCSADWNLDLADQGGQRNPGNELVRRSLLWIGSESLTYMSLPPSQRPAANWTRRHRRAIREQVSVSTTVWRSAQLTKRLFPKACNQTMYS